jgi:hypothetical protein
MRKVIREYFDQVITVLRDGSMMNKLTQVVAGPQWNLGPDDVAQLIDYGVLLQSGRRLAPFSEAFGEYVRFVEHSVEIWPLWRDTERTLREALDTLLIGTFGEAWSSQIKRARPNLTKLVQVWEEKQQKEQSRFGASAVSGLLAYAYPFDLYQLMAADWAQLGEPILGPDKQGWGVKFTILSKVRTPLAHNRDEAVSPAERIQAEGICREILQRCESWKAAVK